MLKHEPTQVNYIADRNIDLMLVGHTHNGQIYPFTCFVKIMYDYTYGLYKINNTKLYVTSGTGVWGPNLRFGTNNEIVVINLKNQIDTQLKFHYYKYIINIYISL